MIVTKKYLFLLSALLCTFSLNATEKPQRISIFANLEKAYLDTQDPTEVCGSRSELVRELNQFTKLSVLYSLFATYARYRGGAQEKSALTTQSWHDLQLIRGGHDTKTSVFNSIDRTITTAGKVKLQELLTQPLTQHDAIAHRQSIVQRLVRDDALYHKLRGLVTQVHSHEDYLFSFWDTDQGAQMLLKDVLSPELSKETKQMMERKKQERKKGEKPIGKILIELFDRTPEGYSDSRAQTNWKGVEFREWTSWPQSILIGIAGILASIEVQGWAANTLTDAPGAYQWFTPVLLRHLWQNKHRITGLIVELGRTGAAEFRELHPGHQAAIIGALLLAAYIVKRMSNRRRKTMYGLQEKMQNVSTFFNSVKELRTVATPLISLDSYDELLATNPQMQELLSLLESKGVHSKAWSRYYTTWMGKNIAAYDLIRVLRPQLAAVFEGIGTVDAYLSIATLVREHRDSPNKFCFPTLVDPHSTDCPELDLTGVWHPLLDAQTAKPSNFALGGDRAERNGILTGPNAGGKSTNLTAITIALVMAQSFGIAAAEKMTFTPFTVINTYMNITEDMAQGRSTFKMEVYRAHQLVKAIETSKKHDYIFSIMDEIFSGTNPIEAQAAAYSIARYLGGMKNSMLIIASHYPIMKRLEADTGTIFKNFMIKANVQPISYPFNLHEGASSQNIALEILREEGFEGEDLLKYADDIMADPGKYGLAPDGVTALS